MDVISFEETCSLIKNSSFPRLQFYQQTYVEDQVIVSIPSEGVYTQAVGEGGRKKFLEGTKPLSSKEKHNLTKHAKALLTSDNRKAAFLVEGLRKKFGRDVVTIQDLSTNNCLYEAVLSQISNAEYTFHHESKRPYGPQDLRLQLLYSMSVDHANFYPKVAPFLDGVCYRQWCIDQLDSEEPADLVAVAGLRYMLQVSNFKIFSPNCPLVKLLNGHGMHHRMHDVFAEHCR